ncbi:hypothetical protein J4447_00350 [Candidatus Pacearchaeota archaeon]|nr:hypothetical protein [Candidatus Pacearchaeota archaeon]
MAKTARENSEVKILKKIGVWSVSRVMAIIGAIYGLVLGLIFALAARSPDAVALNPYLGTLGYWAIIAMPIIYAIAYFVGGAIGIWLYNIVAGWAGGVELHFSK